MSSDANSDLAYDFVRKRILSGEYQPGQRLSATTLAAEIQVSPTPVRDALRQLEADGLVTIRPRLGAQVSAMGLKEFQEFCELRLVLETHTAGLAAQQRSEAELREIEFALGEMSRLTHEMLAAPTADESRLLGELARADIQFHVAIMSAARNDLIRNEILRLHLINRVIARAAWAHGGDLLSNEGEAAHLRAVLADHEAIFEAIARRDAVAAKIAMARSLQDIIDQTIRLMTRQEREQIARELMEDKLSEAV